MGRMMKMFGPHRNGSIAELVCATEALKRDLEVFLPISGSSRIDLVLVKKGTYRVQVKKTWQNSRGNPVCQAVSKSTARHKHKERKFYTQNDIDFLIAVRIEDSSCWILPVEEIKDNTTLGLTSREQYRNAWHMLE